MKRLGTAVKQHHVPLHVESQCSNREVLRMKRGCESSSRMKCATSARGSSGCDRTFVVDVSLDHANGGQNIRQFGGIAHECTDDVAARDCLANNRTANLARRPKHEYSHMSALDLAALSLHAFGLGRQNAAWSSGAGRWDHRSAIDGSSGTDRTIPDVAR